MFFFFFDNKYEIKLDAQPREAHIAFASIDSFGTIGNLNGKVLYDYGYEEYHINAEGLKKGFNLLKEHGLNPIILVVTVNQRDTKLNLKEHLTKALHTYFSVIANEKVWIPLMGTGSGGLSYSESFEITKNVIESFFIERQNLKCEIIISIPEDENGKKLFDQIKKEREEAELDSLNIDSIIKKTNKKHKSKIIEDLNIIDNLVKHLKSNYYFVGYNWDGRLQNKRFYDESIWETGYPDRFTGIIKNISINDLLILKEPITFGNKEYLKVEAIGKVKENNKNGTSVKVDWIIKKLKFTTEDLGYNKATITTAQRDSVVDIFSKLNSNDFQKLVDLTNENNSIFNLSSQEEKKIKDKKYTTTLAGLISDRDTGTDYLDISKDVNAFARVIAAKSFEPPLAIALLGKWGSGKSFFMNKLKESIQTLSQRNPEKQFCEGISHVHFNAWSYMDANLWASIVTRIFEGLDEYVNNLSLSDKEKKEIEQQLFQKLTISKEENDELLSQKKQIKNRLHELKTNKKNINRELKKKITSIRKNSLKELLNKVNEEFKVEDQLVKTLADNPTFVDSAAKFEKIIPKQYWENPSAFYNELKSIHTFIKSFFLRNKLKTNIYWLLVFLILIFITPVFTYLTNLLLSWQDFRLSDKTWFSITIIGTFFMRGFDTYLKLKKQIAPFWNLKEKYEQENEEIIFKFKQEEKALKLEIAQKKEDIIQINKEISNNLEIKATLEYKLQNALSTEALYTFIEKRANSEDYKKHLGIVSLIRKDFEIFSGLLTGHQTELVSIDESKKFKDMFPDKKNLERIILYIDDLDRCPEERVVEVLEAVNLLMAFPLFVVVVGVDPRWVKTALKKKYKNQFTEDKENEDAISPSNYLEKIFQVPFHLKDAEDESIKSMIKTIAQIKPNLVVTEQESEFDSNEFDQNEFNTGTIVEHPKHEEIEQMLNSESTTFSLLNKETIEALNITEKESELLQNMSKIIGNNPRAIKRFVNIYRIVKTHEDFGYDNEETKDVELAVIMFLLALPMGNYKNLIPSLEDFLNGNMTIGFETLDHFLNSDHLHEISKDADLSQDKRKEVYNLLFDYTDLLNQDVELLNLHYQFIKRFTFKNI